MDEWTHMHDQIYHSGYPPLLSDINIGKHLVDGFVYTLLGHHKYVCKELQEFIIANLLRYWKELIGIIKNGPLNNYAAKKLESHTFVYTFIVVCEISGVSKEVFNTRCDDVTPGFITRNVISLPIKDCYDIPGVMIDTR